MSGYALSYLYASALQTYDFTPDVFKHAPEPELRKLYNDSWNFMVWSQTSI